MSTIIRKLLDLPAEATLRQVADALCITLTTAHNWSKRGLLPPIIRLGPRKSLMERDKVVECLRKRDERPAGAPAA